MSPSTRITHRGKYGHLRTDLGRLSTVGVEAGAQQLSMRAPWVGSYASLVPVLESHITAFLLKAFRSCIMSPFESATLSTQLLGLLAIPILFLLQFFIFLAIIGRVNH